MSVFLVLKDHQPNLPFSKNPSKDNNSKATLPILRGDKPTAPMTIRSLANRSVLSFPKGSNRWEVVRILGYENFKKIFIKWIQTAPKPLDKEKLKFFLVNVVLSDDSETLKLILALPNIQEILCAPCELPKGESQLPYVLALKHSLKNPKCQTFKLLAPFLKDGTKVWEFLFFSMPPDSHLSFQLACIFLLDLGIPLSPPVFTELNLIGDAETIAAIISHQSIGNDPFSILMKIIYASKNPIADLNEQLEQGIVGKLHDLYSDNLIEVIKCLLASSRVSKDSMQAAQNFVQAAVKGGYVTNSATMRIILSFSQFSSQHLMPFVECAMEALPRVGNLFVQEEDNNDFHWGLKWFVENSNCSATAYYKCIFNLLELKKFIKEKLKKIRDYLPEIERKLIWMAGSSMNAYPEISIPRLLNANYPPVAQLTVLESLYDFFIKREFGNNTVLQALKGLQHFSTNNTLSLFSGGIINHTVALIVHKVFEDNCNVHVVNTGKGKTLFATTNGVEGRTRTYTNVKLRRFTDKFFNSLRFVVRNSFDMKDFYQVLDFYLGAENICNEESRYHQIQTRDNCTTMAFLAALQVVLGEEIYRKFEQFLLEENLAFIKHTLAHLNAIDEDTWNFLYYAYDTDNREEIVKQLHLWQGAVA